MTIAKDFASKFAVAFVAVAMIFSMFASAVSAQETTEDLQKTINDLLAQVAQLQGDGETTTTTTTTTTVGSCNFMMDLKTGSTGADVMALQKFLNADEDTRVAAAGAVGSAGMETSYFGPATAAAVSKFQVKYRAEILSPAGLVNPTGFFGPSSRAQANMLCAGGEDEDEDEGEDEDEDMGELSGEGSLDDSESDLDDATETDVEEGAEETEIGTLTLAAEDGDIEVTRLDLQLTDVDATVVAGEVTVDGDNEEDLWDTFETISLWVDGEMIGEFDASDEDEYLSEDDGTFRIAGLELVIMEDEEVEIVIGATVMGAVDGSDTLGLADWDLDVTDVRYFDADGVASDDEVTVDAVEFDVVEEGEGDDLELSRATDSPDEGTLALDEQDSTEEMLFSFELDADDSDRDISIEMITVDIAISSTTGEIDDIVEDFYVMIDGDRFDAESFAGNNDTAAVDFDIDGDVEVPAEEVVTVEVYAEFSEMETDSQYQGVTITASVDTADIDAEGAASNLTVGGNDQDGEPQTLRSTGLYAADAAETDTDSEDGVGTFTFTFELTAIEEDMYVNKTAATSFDWTVTGGAATTSATLQSDAEEVGLYYEVAAGQSEEFTLVVTVDPSAAGSFYVTLDDVTYRIDSTSAADTVYSFTPSNEWDTSAVSISAS